MIKPIVGFSPAPLARTEQAPSARAPHAAHGVDASARPTRADVMERSAATPEHKMDIVCPVLAALVKDGRVKMDADGKIKLTQLKNVVSQRMGVSSTMSAALLGIGVVGNKPSDMLGNLMNMQLNVKELRGGMIKHPADSAVLTGGQFDQKKFDALVSHAKDGRMTIESFANAIRANAARDADPARRVPDVIPTSLGGILPSGLDAYVRGAPLSVVEFAPLVNVFGTRDPKTGERYIEVETLRKLYQDKELPPDARMQSRAKTGLVDATATMSRMAWQLAFGSAAGTAQAGAAKALGRGAQENDAVYGAGKATCPYMHGASPKQKPAGENELVAVHSKR